MKKNHFHVKWQTNSDPLILNLDPKFTPINSGLALDFKVLKFLGGEQHIQLEENDYLSHLVITQRFNSSEDIMLILLANDAAKRAGYQKIDLVLPYFPAARQDRVCNEGEPLTVKVFTDLINSCGFNSVHILSPHSEVTPALLNNCVVHDEIPYVYKAVYDILDRTEEKEINIICPDAGAGKRVGKVVKAMNEMFADITFNLIRCEKERDVSDGKLKGFYVQADDLGGHPALIVDDINSMGGTFIGLGGELRKKKCGYLALFTAHADCAAGIANVCKNFNQYYTTNSKKDYKLDDTFEVNNLTVFNITL